MYLCGGRLWAGVVPVMLLLLAYLAFPAVVALTAPTTELSLATCRQPLPQQQYGALFDLYNTTDGPNWAWKNDTSVFGSVWQFPVSGVSNVSVVELAAPCTQHWQGLTCELDSNMTNCVVTEMNLASYNIAGEIPSSMAQLSQLQYLYLYSNSLSGLIPSSLGQLSQLHQFILFSNSLSGPIPSSLGELLQLQDLYLYRNFLTGPIPSSLGQLLQLQYLDLHLNSLSSSIPSSLVQLSQLYDLGLNSNHLSGPIHSSLGQLSQLQFLYLYLNFLTGPIPSSLGLLPQLVEIVLSVNSLGSTIPSSLGELSLLQQLALSYNCLSGTIPSSLGQLLQLQQLIVESNSLSGTIPSSLAQLLHLQELDMNLNSLSGSIPSSLGRMPQLLELVLQSNSLTGFIPSSLGQLPQLQELALTSNPLTGTIPSSLGGLSQLVYLYLFSNFLTGIIPSSLGQMPQLQILLLYSNSLSGLIPTSLGQLPQLLQMDLQFNSLSGPIPSSLGQLPQLMVLYLYSNSLSGPIPSSLGQLSYLQYLYLYSNSLSGPIPSFLGQLSQLVYLYLYSNSLSGPIPSSLGQLSQLQYLYLYSNSLSGPIPFSLGMLKSANVLSLDGNLLTGTITSSLSQLRGCVQLFLNDNQFSGQLEGLFYSSDVFPVLELLDLSDNGFTGSFPVSIFSLRSLRTLSSSSNCFHGSLSGLNASILSGVETINMDGLGSGAACQGLRLTALAKLLFQNPNPGYLPSTLMRGPIPSALWSLPKLTSLSLNGNGFTGSLNLGAFDTLASNLSSVSLAYNRLTGSIPTALQLHGRFEYLDLSYNRLSGTLDSAFTFTVSDSAALNISVNRLSGDIPTANTNILSVQSSELVNTVMRGNLFSFKAPDWVELSISTAVPVYNGSTELNVAVAISSILVLLWIGAATISSLQMMRPTLSTSASGGLGVSLIQWWDAAALLGKGQRTRIHWRRLRLLFRGALVGLSLMSALSVLLGFAALTLKLSPLLQAQYSLYEVQDGWAWSTVYVKGILPIVLILVCVFAVASVHYCAYLPTRRTRLFEAIASKTCRSLAAEIWTAGLLGGGSFIGFVLNATVLLVINALYIASLDSLTSADLTLVQIALAGFKLTWHRFFFWAIQIISSRDYISYVGSLQTIRVLVIVFNYIIAPCLATAVVDSSCFYELFNQQNALPSIGTVFNCDKYNDNINGHYELSCTGSGNSTGIQSGLSQQQLATPFDPPFIYNYQCGSALITNYVPVLLYGFMLSGFIIPVVTLVVLLYPETVRRYLPMWVRKKLFAPAYMLNDDALTPHNPASSESLPSRSRASFDSSLALSPASSDGTWTSHTLASPEQQQPLQPTSTKPIYKPSAVMDQLFLSTLVMMTFGLSTPYLAIVVLCSVLSQAVMFRRLIGRYLHTAEHIEGPAGKNCCKEACGKVEEALQGAWEGPYHTSFIVVVVVVIFWGLLIFDTVGDAWGSSLALQVMVGWMLCAPLLVHWVARAYWYMLALQRRRDIPEQQAQQDVTVQVTPECLAATDGSTWGDLELSPPFLPYDTAVVRAVEGGMQSGPQYLGWEVREEPRNMS